MERRKPKLIVEPDAIEAPKLPFKLATTPLPPPDPERLPTPKLQERVEEKDFVNNKEALQTDEEKERYIFLTNYCATYGNTSAEVAEKAFQDFRARKLLSRQIAKNPDVRRAHVERVRRHTQIPLYIHLPIIAVMFAVFLYFRALHT